MGFDDDRTIVCSPEDMSAGKLCSSCGQIAKGLPPGAAFCPNCGSAFSQVRDFGPGAVIGQYRILKELGSGGIGQVFMAHPVDNPGMRIALKVLQKEFLDNAVPAIKQAIAAAAEARVTGKRIVQPDNVKMKINAI